MLKRISNIILILLFNQGFIFHFHYIFSQYKSNINNIYIILSMSRPAYMFLEICLCIRQLHVVHLVLWLDELLLRDDDCEQDLKGRPLAVSCTSLSSLSPQKFLRGGGWWWWRTLQSL